MTNSISISTGAVCASLALDFLTSASSHARDGGWPAKLTVDTAAEQKTYLLIDQPSTYEHAKGRR